MNWLGDMFLLFIEWWLLMLIPLLLGLLIGYFLWYKKLIEANKQSVECEREFHKLEKIYARKSEQYEQKEVDLDKLVVAYDELDFNLEANKVLLEEEKKKVLGLEEQLMKLNKEILVEDEHEQLEIIEEVVEEEHEQLEIIEEVEEEAQQLEIEEYTIDVDKINEFDDLTSIVGITSVHQSKLNEEGLTTFKDIALLDEDRVQSLESKLHLEAGTIKKKNWTFNAAQRHFETTNEEIYDDIKIEAHYENEFEKQLMEASKGVVLDYVDDLKVIKGVGPKMEKILHSMGVKTYFQLGAFDDDAIADLNDAIDTFPGRIERDEWIKQAKELHVKFHKK